MYTTVEAATDISIKPGTFRQRANRMGLMPDIVGKVFIWNDKQVDLVNRYNRTRSTNFFKYHRMNISIVDFYITHSHNTQMEIANSMGISVSKVNRALTEFLDTGCITVASKMNVDNFNK
jgi:CRP-like cAMP-binding protein